LKRGAQPKLKINIAPSENVNKNNISTENKKKQQQLDGTKENINKKLNIESATLYQKCCNKTLKK
jgi:hypothetical protein